MNYLKSRNRKIIAGMLLALMVALVVGVVVGVHGNQKNNNNLYTGGNSSSSSSVSAWYNSSGYTDMQTVSSDLGQLQTDTDASDSISAESDGSTLEMDAQIAAENPPPVDGAQYVNAMTLLQAAGNDASTGDFAAATTELNAATVQINSITAYLQANGG